MSDKKIRVTFALINSSDKTFRAAIDKDATFKNLRQIVEQRNPGASFPYIFLDNSIMYDDDVVYDFIDSDSIVIFSNTDSVPDTEFTEKVRCSKFGPSPRSSINKIPPAVDSPIDTKFKPPSIPAPSPGKVTATGPTAATADINVSFNNNKPQSTVVNNQNQMGISTSEAQPLVISANDEFIFLSTASKKMLFEGIKIKLNMEWNPQQCQDHLLNQLQANGVNIVNKQLLVYLPGGLPFLGGQLKDIYTNPNPTVKHLIYGVLADKNIPTTLLNSSTSELCNVSDENHKRLLSPLCNSSFKGLCDIACLLGYLNHDGVKGDLLFRSFATVIHFAPLTTSMKRILNRQGITGRDVVTFCSTFYAFSRQLLPNTISDDKVYEYGLRICNLVSHINDIPETVPVKAIEIQSGQPAFLVKIKQPNFLYFYNGDVEDTFNRREFELSSPKAIEDAYKVIASFTPIAPLSTRVVNGCSIIRGKDHTYLYLMQSCEKASQNKVDIIDPSKGFSESVDLEQFAQKQGNTATDDIANLIDPDQVKQVIQVCFDESDSMNWSLNGKTIRNNKDEFPRVTIAYQYLTTFANRAYAFRIPCIQGLVSFNNEITVRCPLSPLVPDFEDKGLKNVKPTGRTRLWDAIYKSAQDLVKYMNLDDKSNLKYRNAKPRILVISDGDDVGSTATIEEVAKELIKYKIVLDCVIVSKKDSCKPLSALSHITGGLSFRPETIIDGLRLFEKSAFFNLDERRQLSELFINDNPGSGTGSRVKVRLTTLKPDMITQEFIQKVINNTDFDTEIVNKELAIASSTSLPLATPEHVCCNNRNAEIPEPRRRRILRELHRAAEVQQPETGPIQQLDNSSYSRTPFDPDLKIYTYKANLDRWRVYIKGPEGTPYANKWWYLFVTFPPLYPVEPPLFRFISIPYHFNVSSEGRICLNIIEKGYLPTKHVVDILQEIKGLFLIPCVETPIQMDIFELFKTNYDEYSRLARQSAIDNAKDNYEDYQENIYINCTVSDNYAIEFTDYVPPYMRSQISGRAIDPRNIVLSSTRVPYDRNELYQLITTNRNPICVITGRLLTDDPNDPKFDGILA